MSSEARITEAINAAILAAAHVAAYERVGVAATACQRLGTLSSGRWRSAGRDLEQIADDLETSLDQVAQDVTQWATELEVEEETLWTVGDAAETWTTLLDEALDELEEESAAVRLIESGALFGVAFLDDPESDDRGQTLLFHWANPLEPAVWSWEASWVGQEDDEKLELFSVAELDAADGLLDDVAGRMATDRAAAAQSLSSVAQALTRASILAALGEGDDDDDDDEEESDVLNGHR